MAPPTLKLQRTMLTDCAGKLYVEMVYAEKPEDDGSMAASVTIRLPAEENGNPALRGVELKCLEHVRALIHDEIERLHNTRGQQHRI